MDAVEDYPEKQSLPFYDLLKYSECLKEGLVQIRQDLFSDLRKKGSFIGHHFQMGMAIRNHLRQSHKELTEEGSCIVLDDNWQPILLCAMEFTKEELESFPIDEWLTDSDESVRETAWVLQELTRRSIEKPVKKSRPFLLRILGF